jgi:hypothetical protein
MAHYAKKTPKRIDIFLETLATGYSVTAAATAAGVNRYTVYQWRSIDPAFAAQWESALEQGTDVLEDELRRRAYIGVEEPIFWKGNKIATAPKYSDTMLMFFLRGRRPEKYREFQQTPSGSQLDQLIAVFKP